jgi:hypothetical protein
MKCTQVTDKPGPHLGLRGLYPGHAGGEGEMGQSGRISAQVHSFLFLFFSVFLSFYF